MVYKVQITKSPQETFELGKKLADNLKENRVIALYGELGSGKTTFIQGLAKGLGIRKRIISPTFIFVREYRIYPKRMFYHLDLYRINSLVETKSLGLEEIFGNPANIVAVEWAEKIKEILPKRRIDVFFKYVDEKTRRLNLH